MAQNNSRKIWFIAIGSAIAISLGFFFTLCLAGGVAFGESDDSATPSLKMSQKASIGDSSDFVSMVDMTPICAMNLGTPMVGQIDWCDGKIKFKGKFEDSGEIFFKYFWEVFVAPDWEEYVKWRKEVKDNG